MLQAGQPEAAATIYQRLKADPAEPIRAACLWGLAAARPTVRRTPDGGPVGAERRVVRPRGADHSRRQRRPGGKVRRASLRLPPLGQAAPLDGLRERRGGAVAAAVKASRAAIHKCCLPQSGRWDRRAWPPTRLARQSGHEGKHGLAPRGRMDQPLPAGDKDADGVMAGLLAGSPPELQITLIRGLAAGNCAAAAGPAEDRPASGRRVRIEAYKVRDSLPTSRTSPSRWRSSSASSRAKRRGGDWRRRGGL